MNKAANRLIGMRQNPHDWGIGDVESVCKEYGISCSSPKRGSHYKVSHPSEHRILTIPAKRPIKAIYIRRLVTFINNVREDDDG